MNAWARWWAQDTVRLTTRTAGMAVCIYGLCCVGSGSLALFGRGVPVVLRAVVGVLALVAAFAVVWYGRVWYRQHTARRRGRAPARQPR